MLDFLKRNLRWILIIFFLILSLQILTFDISHPGKTGIFTKIVITITTYPVKAIDSITRSIGRVWDNYIYLVNVKKENDLLKKKVEQLLSELQELKEYRLENERLKKLLGFVDEKNYEYLSAKVIGINEEEGLRVVVIDKGSRDGIEEGSAVLVPEGVVGRVFRLGRNSSHVMLITDPRSKADVRFERTRVRAILRGTGSICEAEFVKNEEDVVRGDILITSGLGGVFPPGNPVGVVQDVETDSTRLFKKISVIPSAHLDTLDEVIVVKRQKGSNETD